MNFNFFSLIGTIGLCILSFLVLSEGTIIGDFFLWLPFGYGWFAGIISFLINNHAYVGSVFFVMFFLKWTRNPYLLAFFCASFIVFVKFGLRSVGIGST